jgi:uncharacterized protein (DUF58 family)
VAAGHAERGDRDAAPFSPAFRTLLLEIIRRAPRARDAVDRRGPARRRLAARSGTFAGHRRYGAGDDVRDVDWHAYARTRELFAKVVEDEERRTLTLLVDSSLSQDVGAPARRLATLRFAAIEGALALARLDALHLVLGDGRAVTLHGAAALEQMLGYLEQAPRVQLPLVMVQRPLQAGFTGRLLWISDFVPPEDVAPALRLLRRHGRRCTGVIPEQATDRVPDVRGVVALRDPETGARHVVRVDRALQAAVREELLALRRAQDAVFGVCGYDLVRVPAPRAGDLSLASWSRPWHARAELRIPS